MPDVVYVVRPGEENDELRYSLRSLANLPHDRVWIVGYTPSWVAGVQSLHTIQGRSKYENSTRNVVTACTHDDISDPFILMNDDFHIVRPVDQVPTLHRGPLDRIIDIYARKGNGPYVTGMRQTRDLLRQLGHDEPVSYELHVPMVVAKRPMLDGIQAGLDAGVSVIHKRTMYGNLAHIGGTETNDVKVYEMDQPIPRGPFLSSLDRTFRYGVGNIVRWLFPDPCTYEVEGQEQAA